MLLESIHSPADVRALPDGQLPQLCQELREFLVQSVSETGGHLASNLGAVELTVAIHKVFDTERDRLIFDVGHQCYVHKVLTGRREDFPVSPNLTKAYMMLLLPDMPPTLCPWLWEWPGPALCRAGVTVFWP